MAGKFVLKKGPTTLWQLAAHTGMRQAEILGLSWRDVDVDVSTSSFDSHSSGIVVLSN